ncbi:PBP1A family penicillin-binding protein [Vibrio profundum]|uniref:penicillin-binding protein 1A n=1 Tax=Vibrio profundum TaxID=2910247 RepID=UPI003D1099A2
MKFIKRLFIFSLICTVLGVGTIFGVYLYVKPSLPDVATLRDVKLQTPMQVFSQDGKLIAEYGEKRRIPVTFNEIPQNLINALIATEDSRFYEHPGFDPIGIMRAAVVVAISGHAKQGASTITQQLARNFFLSDKKSIMRKVKEIFIAVHIEHLLTKNEILQLYINKIFLGYRSYGFGAAAQVYFGKPLQQLDLSQIAVLAGLPKAPSTFNPIYSVKRATDRRDTVLLRMLEENYITQAQFDQAKSEPVIASYHAANIQIHAPYVAEMARSWAVAHYGDDAYTSGLNIYTTVTSKLQHAANHAAIDNLLGYDERHGYRGPQRVLWQPNQTPFTDEQIKSELKQTPTYGSLSPAIVTAVNEKNATVWVKHQGQQTIIWDGMNWARRYLTDDRQGPAPSDAHDILAVGQEVWVRQVDTPKQDQNNFPDKMWALSQVPTANAAFVAMNPDNGAILALVGGFNYIHSKFNRATQSIRQVGSSIKPFIYSSALNSGMTLATLINDAPINKWDKSQGTAWRPQNSPPVYLGPTRLRIGLAQSINVMSIRVLRAVGLENVRHYLTRFGFKLDQLPDSETIALGAGSLTPVQMAQGYSVFANGGYFVKPFYISKIIGPYGDVLYQADPSIVCHSKDCEDAVPDGTKPQEQNTDTGADTSDQIATTTASTAANDAQDNINAPVSAAADSTSLQNRDELAQTTPTLPEVRYAKRVISKQNAFLVRQMMYSNIWGGGNWSKGTGWNGTGWRAQVLKRRDIGGKTGTTNDSKDTWYNGFGPNIVATSWVGFDAHSRDLGHTSSNPNLTGRQITGAESGAKTAEPAWINFMHADLQDHPEHELVLPPNIIRVRIDRATGLLTNKTDYTSRFEYFVQGTQPKEYVSDSGADNNSATEQIF